VVGEPGVDAGQLARPGGFERHGVAPVQVHALTRQQLPDQHVGHQAVPQPVAVGSVVNHDDTGVDRLPESIEEVRPTAVQHGIEEPMRQRPVAERDGAHGAQGRFGQAVDAREDELAQRRRQARRIPVHGRPQRLLGDERVAGRALPDELDQVRPARGEGVHHGRHRLPAQRCHLQAPHLAVPPELTDHRARRRGVRGQLRAVGRDDEHALVCEVRD
jgi:hypothetical protein